VAVGTATSSCRGGHRFDPRAACFNTFSVASSEEAGPVIMCCLSPSLDRNDPALVTSATAVNVPSLSPVL
jgi:flavin reductase (DIM6/NTAB) family NADH-FMN oxidoreductase RutF